jgi:hypothetical protein
MATIIETKIESLGTEKEQLEITIQNLFDQKMDITKRFNEARKRMEEITIVEKELNK